jgi:predicted Zn-dependent protease
MLVGFVISFFASNMDFGVPRLVLVLAPIGVLLLLIVCALAFALFRPDVSRVIRAIEQANAGDAEGAILELRRQVEANGYSALRANALASLLVVNKRSDEAIRMLDEAEKLGVDRATILSNRGFILLESGNPEAAVSLLEEAARVSPDQIEVLCNLCRALAEVGRIEEARTQLRLAEDGRKRTFILGAEGRRLTSETLQKCRDQLAALKPTAFRELDEL